MAEAEADSKHAESMLKNHSKSAKYLKKGEEAKAVADEAREKLRDLVAATSAACQ